MWLPSFHTKNGQRSLISISSDCILRTCLKLTEIMPIMLLLIILTMCFVTSGVYQYQMDEQNLYDLTVHTKVLPFTFHKNCD